MAPILNTTNPIAKRTRPTLDQRRCPPVIPPEHPSRTLVLCFDGTGDANNSNIVQLVSLLKQNDSTNQLVYYQVRFSKKSSVRRGWREAFCIFFKAGHWRVLWHWQRSDSPCVHNSQGISPTCFKCSLSLYLLIQALDEIVAWSIDTHIMGMSLYPTQESTPDHIDTN